mmetsp:Transcript_58620/g.150774  ORF Transcript_58620/g.150774 Transcript_58620/m.150774 type:complete len:419 (+) Transcript_58620:166-1422(+)
MRFLSAAFFAAASASSAAFLAAACSCSHFSLALRCISCSCSFRRSPLSCSTSGSGSRGGRSSSSLDKGALSSSNFPLDVSRGGVMKRVLWAFCAMIHASINLPFRCSAACVRFSSSASSSARRPAASFALSFRTLGASAFQRLSSAFIGFCTSTAGASGSDARCCMATESAGSVCSSVSRCVRTHSSSSSRDSRPAMFTSMRCSTKRRSRSVIALASAGRGNGAHSGHLGSRPKNRVRPRSSDGTGSGLGSGFAASFSSELVPLSLLPLLLSVLPLPLSLLLRCASPRGCVVSFGCRIGCRSSGGTASLRSASVRCTIHSPAFLLHLFRQPTSLLKSQLPVWSSCGPCLTSTYMPTSKFASTWRSLRRSLRRFHFLRLRRVLGALYSLGSKRSGSKCCASPRARSAGPRSLACKGSVA